MLGASGYTRVSLHKAADRTSTYGTESTEEFDGMINAVNDWEDVTASYLSLKVTECVAKRD